MGIFQYTVSNTSIFKKCFDKTDLNKYFSTIITIKRMKKKKSLIHFYCSQNNKNKKFIICSRTLVLLSRGIKLFIMHETVYIKDNFYLNFSENKISFTCESFLKIHKKPWTCILYSAPQWVLPRTWFSTVSGLKELISSRILSKQWMKVGKKSSGAKCTFFILNFFFFFRCKSKTFSVRKQ